MLHVSESDTAEIIHDLARKGVLSASESDLLQTTNASRIDNPQGVGRLVTPNAVATIREYSINTPLLPGDSFQQQADPPPRKYGCLLDDFRYPSYLSTYGAFKSWTHLGEDATRPGEEKSIGEPMWRCGFYFEAEAEFKNSARWKCRCCSFQQLVLVFDVYRVGKWLDDRVVGQVDLDSDIIDWTSRPDTSKKHEFREYGDRQLRRGNRTTNDAFTTRDVYEANKDKLKRQRDEYLKLMNDSDAVSYGATAEREAAKRTSDPAEIEGAAARLKGTPQHAKLAHSKTIGELEELPRVDNEIVMGTFRNGPQSFGCFYVMSDAPRIDCPRGVERFTFWRFTGRIVTTQRRDCQGFVMTQGVPETKWFSGWVRADYADRELTKEQGPKTSYEFDIPEKNCVKDFRYGTIRKPGYTRRALSRGGVRVMEGERETSGVLAVADLDEAVKNAQAKERSLDSDTRDPVVK